ncbi:MAG: hypothetical protein FJ361_06880 [Gemmatimonadetes bacterium]|nr:hypothetical protein [Gemmatimonadota bacterium]
MILAIHNLLRWAVLLTGILAIVQAVRGLDGRTPFAKTRPILLAFTANLHLQLLIGLTLFVVSPTVKAYMADMAATMRDGSRRFFIAEHPTLMVAGVLLATIGGVIAKNAPDDAARHRRALIFTVLTVLLILAGIPWSRPLLPSF